MIETEDTKPDPQDETSEKENRDDIRALIRRAMDRFPHVRAFLARAEAEEARPMTSLYASLTPEQQERVRTYDGPINHGSEEFKR